MFSKKDDIMRLLITRRSRTSLDIVPEIHANIGRFICSVTKETQSQKNVFNYIVFYLYLMQCQSVRFKLDGEARVFLYSIREIEENEILFYDYNEGGNEYPTENFK